MFCWRWQFPEVCMFLVDKYGIKVNVGCTLPVYTVIYRHTYRDVIVYTPDTNKWQASGRNTNRADSWHKYLLHRLSTTRVYWVWCNVIKILTVNPGWPFLLSVSIISPPCLKYSNCTRHSFSCPVFRSEFMTLCLMYMAYDLFWWRQWGAMKSDFDNKFIIIMNHLFMTFVRAVWLEKCL